MQKKTTKKKMITTHKNKKKIAISIFQYNSILQ